ncbi:Transglutaminase domain-containing protein [Candidatus Zixiibacteriota bacterium]|nr:Transglutaminase domain-containing protein [candidate division Zixibacteria bacterium]
MSKTYTICFAIFMTLSGVVFKTNAQSINYPDDIAAVLDSAGENRVALEEVLFHYRDDSLKFQAACFLIRNMPGHSYVTYKLVDTAGNEVLFNALEYPTYDSLNRAFDAIQAKTGDLDFRKKDLFDDTKTIRADFLINHIDYAFRARTEKPWAKWLTFDQFCQYVLPYRGSNEPLEDWRPYFWEKYINLPKEMKDSTDPVEAASLINNDIRKWFTFSEIYYYHPTDQGLEEMRQSGKGRCEDMTNLAIFAMRANGLAVTSDYTPFWGNAGNNHAWNAILLPDGRVVPFMGDEANPGEYKLANKIAKAYRKTYEDHPENLVFQERKQKKIPGWLAGKSYIDVTPAYARVSNLNINLDAPLPDSIDIAYLCVFNSGEWQAIQWGRAADSTALFKEMGRDILYLPALYINEKIVPGGTPFILDTVGTMHALAPDTSTRVALTLISITNPKLEWSTEGIEKTKVKPGQEYELFYWNGEWLSLGKVTSDDRGVSFANVPSGALYWLRKTDSSKEERVFTMENGEQKWW